MDQNYILLEEPLADGSFAMNDVRILDLWSYGKLPTESSPNLCVEVAKHT